MTSDFKIKVAEALFPILTAFHEVSGHPLAAVRQNLTDEYPSTIVLNFGDKSLILRANGDDDTVDFKVISSFDADGHRGADSSHLSPWADMIGRPFGWGWVMVNQQGHLDGVLFSFEGVIPQYMITVAASGFQVSRIS